MDDSFITDRQLLPLYTSTPVRSETGDSDIVIAPLTISMLRCSIENRGYTYIYILYIYIYIYIVRANCIVRANFVLITRKVGGA